MEFKLARRCRVCLEYFHGTSMRSLHHKEIRKMFQECTNLMVLSGDGCPQQLCSRCFERCLKSYEFRKEAIESDKKLTLALLFPKESDGPVDAARCEAEPVEIEEEAGFEPLAEQQLDSNSVGEGDPPASINIDDRATVAMDAPLTEANTRDDESNNKMSKSAAPREIPWPGEACSAITNSLQKYPNEGTKDASMTRTAEGKPSKEDGLGESESSGPNTRSEIELGESSEDFGIKKEINTTTTETESNPISQMKSDQKQTQPSKDGLDALQIKVENAEDDETGHLVEEEDSEVQLISFKAEIVSINSDDEATPEDDPSTEEEEDIDTSYNGSTFKFICKLCGLSCNSRNELQNHQQVHDVASKSVEFFIISRNGKSVRCKVCSEVVLNDYNSRLQHRRLHTGGKPYACSVCGESFAFLHILSRHHLRYHDVADLKCKGCKRSFANSTEFEYHKETSWRCYRDKSKLHPRDVLWPWSCDECVKDFSCRSDLIAHMQNHKPEPQRRIKWPWTCEECNRKFSSQTRLISHREIHNNKIKKCQGDTAPAIAPEGLTNKKRPAVVIETQRWDKIAKRGSETDSNQ